MDAAAFAYYRVKITSGETTREKSAGISWIGANTPPLKKGKASVDKPELRSVIRDSPAEISAGDLADLAYDRIEDKLRSARD